MNLIRAVKNTSSEWRKKDVKRSGQHTSVVFLTTLVVDGSPRSKTPRRKVRTSAQQGRTDNWSAGKLPKLRAEGKLNMRRDVLFAKTLRN